MTMRQLKFIRPVKPLKFLGSTKRTIKEFPQPARYQAGSQLWMVQLGDVPVDWKPLPSIAPGVMEIRIHEPTEHRVIYVAKFPNAIYVLGAFEKKTKKTSHKHLEQARRNYAQAEKEQQN